MSRRYSPNLTSMYDSYAWNWKQYKRTGHSKYKENAGKWFTLYRKFGGKRKKLK